MRFKTVLFGLILMSASSLFGGYNSLDTNAFLKSTALRETNGKYWLIGSKGERSSYQFMKETWKRYSHIDFHHASDKAYQFEVDRVARAYLRSILNALEREGLPVTVHNIALKWTGGPESHYYTKEKWDYANDVENLYQSSLSSNPHFLIVSR